MRCSRKALPRYSSRYVQKGSRGASTYRPPISNSPRTALCDSVNQCPWMCPKHVASERASSCFSSEDLVLSSLFRRYPGPSWAAWQWREGGCGGGRSWRRVVDGSRPRDALLSVRAFGPAYSYLAGFVYSRRLFIKAAGLVVRLLAREPANSVSTRVCAYTERTRPRTRRDAPLHLRAPWGRPRHHIAVLPALSCGGRRWWRPISAGQPVTPEWRQQARRRLVQPRHTPEWRPLRRALGAHVGPGPSAPTGGPALPGGRRLGGAEDEEPVAHQGQAACEEPGQGSVARRRP